MDYPNRRRLKVMGRLRFEAIEDADPALGSAVALPDYRARIERVGVIEVEAFDWNCPQHITPRFTIDEVDAVLAQLRERVRELEAEVAALRG